MTTFAVDRELCRLVVRIRCLVVILGMATGAGVGGIIKIAIMTSSTIILNDSMCPIQRVELIVIKRRRYPGRFRMAAFAVNGELRRLVIRIGRLVVICSVTPEAGVGCIIVIAVVAACAIVGNGGMRPV